MIPSVKQLEDIVKRYRIIKDHIPMQMKDGKTTYVYGETYPDARTIILNRRNVDAQNKVTLMHKLLHAHYIEQGVNIDCAVIEGFAQGLLTKPEYGRFIKSVLEPKYLDYQKLIWEQKHMRERKNRF